MSKKKFWLIIIGVIAFLSLGFNLWAIFFYAPKFCFTDNEIKKSQFSLLNPARSIYEQKDLIVNVQPLRDELDKIGADPDISIYFEYLPTGANIAVNKEAEFFPASLVKLPVVMAAAKKVASGQWRWQNELVLMSNDKDDKFGELYQSPIGTTFTIDDLSVKALAESDNTAYHMLLRNLEPAELEEMHQHLGLEDFFTADGKISAKKYSVILRALYGSSYLPEEYSQKLLKIMTQSSFNQYLASGLPKDILFAHKIGVSDEQDVVLDAGIVYLPGRPYLLAVMIKTKDMAAAEIQMKNISEKVYSYIANYSEEK
ncbi:MAG: class A beta-lactamase-related serine hydrolase [Patescibacteria group bacterium]|nr:class A beta-lactamase-related serine hydrolase [Patescibacteria group bacterium]